MVLGDGKEIWRSGPVKKSDAVKPLKIDITGVRHLVLRITGGGEGQGPREDSRGLGERERDKEIMLRPRVSAFSLTNKFTGAKSRRTLQQ